jgi:nitrite reductase/ring-hydroxylating ferredoxin subunit
MALDGARLWDGLIDCPWHHFQFDVVTGKNVYPRRVYPSDRRDLMKTVRCLRTFPTHIEGRNVFVQFPSRVRGRTRVQQVR